MTVQHRVADHKLKERWNLAWLTGHNPTPMHLSELFKKLPNLTIHFSIFRWLKTEFGLIESTQSQEN